MKNRERNGKGQNKESDEESSMDSADCDEKRSYTPEPRHLETL